jgi:Fe-S cluster assembly iron-binding protein IscA
MNISIDDATKNALRDMLKEKNKDSVRIVIKGFG